MQSLPVISDQLIPTPDILVADVGATIVDGTSLEPFGRYSARDLDRLAWRSCDSR